MSDPYRKAQRAVKLRLTGPCSKRAEAEMSIEASDIARDDASEDGESGGESGEE